MTKKLSISIVIPAFNEERHLSACLDAIAAQTVKPREVIVVDNNSTDRTAAIAKSYKFVKLVKEPVQGRGPARSKGFNLARGDIIGRIDADSVIDVNWVKRVLADFSDNSVFGVTGLGRTNFLPRIKLFYSTFWSRMYYWNIHAHFRAISLWGANMAIRKSAWNKVKNQVCLDDNLVHEDQDLSVLLASQNLKIIQDDKLLITTAGQSYHYFPKLFNYSLLLNQTIKLHKTRGTLPVPRSVRLGFWQVLPGWMFTLLPGLPFLIFSLIFLPLDLVMLKIFKSKTWLD
jgi:glycosyltransferase involved in cell wall biosynthesis